MRIWNFAALAALSFISCQYPWSPGERSCADQARVDLPIDLKTFQAHGSLRPFGLHGGVNPEGHPGIDFILEAADTNVNTKVTASFSADVISVTPETEYPGSSCLVMDSACVEVNLCHLHLDPKIKPGMRVTRGQILGTIGLLPNGQYNLHMGTYFGNDAQLTCPAEFLDLDTVNCYLGQSVGKGPPASCSNRQDTLTMLGRSTYPESSARELVVKCSDGTSQVFSLPAETAFCAERLSTADRGRMNACLGSACAGIW